jgi:hypothetical protein
MNAPREIRIDSLEAFSTRCDVPEYEAEPSRVPTEWLEEYDALWDGTAVLRLPDGSRWLSSRSLPAEQDDDRAISRYVLEHTVLRAHASALHPPEIFLNADTLDVRHVYCTECRKFFDLESEWLEAEGTLDTWEE